MSEITVATDLSASIMPTIDFLSLDYTEIDQGLNLWSELFPMIEKEIITLTAVAQEMQECSGNRTFTVVHSI
jgi:hypothetical protein